MCHTTPKLEDTSRGLSSDDVGPIQIINSFCMLSVILLQ